MMNTVWLRYSIGLRHRVDAIGVRSHSRRERGEGRGERVGEESEASALYALGYCNCNCHQSLTFAIK